MSFFVIFGKFGIEQIPNFSYIGDVHKPLFLTTNPSKTGFFDPKTGNYSRTYFRTIFAKFLQVKKDWIFPKNFRTSITELFQNSQKTKSSENSVFHRALIGSEFPHLSKIDHFTYLTETGRQND
jgi:hypothetical protein